MIRSTRFSQKVLKCTSKRLHSEEKKMGKVVLISGASSGIGEALSLKYAKLGCRLLLSARREDRLLALSVRLLAEGAGDVKIVPCDISIKTECQSLIEKTIQHFGGIDVLVLNAGVGQVFFVEAMHQDVQFERFMDVNYYGCVYPALAALPQLQQSNGRIVVVSSLGGLIPFPRQTFYNASKYALIGFFETLRLELQSKRSGVSISIVCPGFVQTEITGGGGIGRDGKPIGVDPTSKKSMPLPVITAEQCADDIISAVSKRTPLLITPYWYKPIYFLRKLFPNTIDRLIIKLFAPSPKKRHN